jgi:hypothetical protein
LPKTVEGPHRTSLPRRTTTGFDHELFRKQLAPERTVGRDERRKHIEPENLAGEQCRELADVRDRARPQRREVPLQELQRLPLELYRLMAKTFSFFCL